MTLENSCIICGCVKNCEKYIESIFANIQQIQSLFSTTKIIISFDVSNDKTLKKLCEMKRTFDVTILINKNPLTDRRTVNIARARNELLEEIYTKYADYQYFIMMDFDDVCSKPIQLDALRHGFLHKGQWDGLCFNNENYYDYWALSFDEFKYSCWHCDNPVKLINIMNANFKKRMEGLSGSFMSCDSAFGGFGIYKIDKFKDCRYQSEVDFELFRESDIALPSIKYDIQYFGGEGIFDCEHRYFHMNARRKNNIQLKISKMCIFPPYEGEHTYLLNK